MQVGKASFEGLCTSSLFFAEEISNSRNCSGRGSNTDNQPWHLLSLPSPGISLGNVWGVEAALLFSVLGD